MINAKRATGMWPINLEFMHTSFQTWLSHTPTQTLEVYMKGAKTRQNLVLNQICGNASSSFRSTMPDTVQPHIKTFTFPCHVPVSCWSICQNVTVCWWGFNIQLNRQHNAAESQASTKISLIQALWPLLRIKRALQLFSNAQMHSLQELTASHTACHTIFSDPSSTRIAIAASDCLSSFILRSALGATQRENEKGARNHISACHDVDHSLFFCLFFLLLLLNMFSSTPIMIINMAPVTGKHLSPLGYVAAPHSNHSNHCTWYHCAKSPVDKHAMASMPVILGTTICTVKCCHSGWNKRPTRACASEIAEVEITGQCPTWTLIKDKTTSRWAVVDTRNTRISYFLAFTMIQTDTFHLQNKRTTEALLRMLSWP